jgi:hypothetical protein
MAQRVGAFAHTPAMQQPFVGSEAVARGDVTKAELRSRYRRVFRDVYLAPGLDLTPELRAKAGWLWSRRRAVVAGLTASALHGAKWVDASQPIELIHDNRHRLPGLQIRGDLASDDEIVKMAGIPVTTPERTALDLACWYPLEQALVAVDALASATSLKILDVERLAARYPGRRGTATARAVFDLVDAGAESPRETLLRLLIIEAGLPRPDTQIQIYDRCGYLVARADMGWPDLRIAIEYEGDHHRTDERQFNRDIVRIEQMQSAGWIVIRVTAKDRPDQVLSRIRAAIARRA